DPRRGGAQFGFVTLNPPRGRKILPRLPVRTAAAEKGATEYEIRRNRIRYGQLVFQFRHASPGVEHMRHLVATQAGEVVGLEKFLVANLQRIAKMARKLRQKRIQPLDEGARIGKNTLGKCAEFENKRRDLIPIGIEQTQKSTRKQRGIEKRRVLHASLPAIARVDREYLAGDLLGNFEGELKALPRLAEKPAPEALGRKLVEGEVAANGREGLGVFAQTLRFEGLLREAAAAQIT